MIIIIMCILSVPGTLGTAYLILQMTLQSKFYISILQSGNSGLGKNNSVITTHTSISHLTTILNQVKAHVLPLHPTNPSNTED